MSDEILSDEQLDAVAGGTHFHPGNAGLSNVKEITTADAARMLLRPIDSSGRMEGVTNLSANGISGAPPTTPARTTSSTSTARPTPVVSPMSGADKLRRTGAID